MKVLGFTEENLKYLLKIILLCYLFFSILSGKEIQAFEVNGLRASQWVMLIVSPVAIILFFKYKLFKLFEVKILLVIFFIGFIQLIRGYIYLFPENFILGHSGIFIYPVFFLFGYLFFESKDVVLIFGVIFLGCLLGISYYVGSFYIENGQLPFLIRASSDILPAMAGGLMVSILCYAWVFNKRYLVLLLPFILFSYLILVKGVLLAAILALLLILCKAYLKSMAFVVVVFVTGVLYLIYEDLPHIITLANNGDIFWFNISYRFLVWKDYVQLMFTSIESGLYGNGVTPFFSNTVFSSFSSPWFVSDCNGIIDSNPHNSYLLILYYSGVIGLVPFLLLLGRVFALRKIVYDKNVLLLLPLALVLCLMGLTTPVLELHFLAPICWVLLGVIFKVRAVPIETRSSVKCI
ncbi:hypothetical protein [Thiomicrorhabdus arctica]|uniref:hypothetical protein n=1 Tax=Thiomicrorhabdus arctica TaxID=131540 RepID=UPI000362B5FE|nr:hypothetical protein [Thiomicrorhabdus arctica]